MTDTAAPVQFRLAHLSASSISDWLECPARWYARRVLGEQGPPNADMAIGSAIHAAVEAHHKGEDAELALIKAWADVRETNPPPRALPRALEGLGLYRQAVPALDGDKPERFFRAKLPGVPIPLIGYFDLDRPGEVHDLKTTRGRWWTQQRCNESLQATAYWYARTVMKRPVERVVFHILRIADPVRITPFVTVRTDAQVAEFLETARRVYDEIQAAITVGRAEPKCRAGRCRYPAVCTAWGLENGDRGAACSGLLAAPQ